MCMIFLFSECYQNITWNPWPKNIFMIYLYWWIFIVYNGDSEVESANTACLVCILVRPKFDRFLRYTKAVSFSGQLEFLIFLVFSCKEFRVSCNHQFAWDKTGRCETHRERMFVKVPPTTGVKSTMDVTLVTSPFSRRNLNHSLSCHANFGKMTRRTTPIWSICAILGSDRNLVSVHHPLLRVVTLW